MKLREITARKAWEKWNGYKGMDLIKEIICMHENFKQQNLKLKNKKNHKNIKKK